MKGQIYIYSELVIFASGGSAKVKKRWSKGHADFFMVTSVSF